MHSNEHSCLLQKNASVSWPILGENRTTKVTVMPRPKLYITSIKKTSNNSCTIVFYGPIGPSLTISAISKKYPTFEGMFFPIFMGKTMVFCYQNCSDQVREKNVLVIN